MTVAIDRHGALLRRGAPLPAFDALRPFPVAGRLRRAAEVVGDLLAIVAIAFCFPLVILAIGMPIVLFARLLLWILALL